MIETQRFCSTVAHADCIVMGQRKDDRTMLILCNKLSSDSSALLIMQQPDYVPDSLRIVKL